MQEITLNEDQQKASSKFTEFLIDPTAKFMVIMGAAGTGKSTLVKSLLKTIEPRLKLYAILLGSKEEVPEFKVELTATTNKAAAVLSKLTGEDCVTVHSKLGLVPQQNYATGEVNFIRGKEHKTIYNTLLVVDEASFLDDKLFTLIDESTVDCKILFIGDQYQLAPVNQVVPIMNKIKGYVVSLEKIMRHGGNIAQAGAKFRETVKTKQFSPIIADGIDVIHVNGPVFQDMINQEFTHPEYSESKARVLAWQNETVNMYNNYIREILGHPPQFGIGDVLSTNRPIMGKMGTIAGTDASVEIAAVAQEDVQHGLQGKRVKIIGSSRWFFLPDNPVQAGAFMKQLRKEKKWPLFFRLQDEWLDLRPAFASTVHKAQGSTYDTVFINLTDIGRCFIASDVARMMYVALTRAAKRVVLYGQLPPMYQGVFNESQLPLHAETA